VEIAVFHPACICVNSKCMTKSTLNVNTKSKKIGRPVTTGKGELIGVRLLPDLLGAVDQHQAAVGAESRPEAIRQILTSFLTKKGYLARGEK
jgi:hypothetical protein